MSGNDPLKSIHFPLQPTIKYKLFQYDGVFHLYGNTSGTHSAKQYH